VVDMDNINYGKLVDEAMHLIVYKVLKNVQENGLPRDHHFFISFLTQHPKVKISKALKNKYPHEITIVLQYQFHDLKVTKEGFEVTLSFAGSKENIYVPLVAITTFADPSVQFGLQFREAEQIKQSHEDQELEMITEEIRKQLEDEIEEELHDLHDHKHTVKDTPKSKPKGKGKSKRDDENVVSLDKFRKTHKNGD